MHLYPAPSLTSTVTQGGAARWPLPAPPRAGACYPHYHHTLADPCHPCNLSPSTCLCGSPILIARFAGRTSGRRRPFEEKRRQVYLWSCVKGVFQAGGLAARNIHMYMYCREPGNVVGKGSTGGLLLGALFPVTGPPRTVPGNPPRPTYSTARHSPSPS